MFTIFNTALSGLSAISTAVDIVGNNLANLNTVGYKASTVSFHDLMGTQMGTSSGTAAGIGVAAPLSTRHFTQGSIQQSTGAFDAAIEGQGFFVVRDNNGRQLYTRAGNFTIDASGHLVTATGQFVQGWASDGGTLSISGAPADLVLPMSGLSPAKATATVSFSGNLDAGATAGDASATYSVPLQIVDSLGSGHTITVTFNKSAAGKWDYTAAIPAADLKQGGTTQLAKGTLSFDANGKLDPATKPVSLSITGFANGAGDANISWNLTSGGAGLITQFAEKSGVSAANQDGRLSGQITGVGLADGGLLVARYSSGQQQTIGQIALASITNPESLVSVGDNNLAATPGTSAAAIGPAGSSGRGSVIAGALEASTVDIAVEFTNLITFQRSYAANSRVITTGDEMLQDLVNIKR